jgi:hypothetical protein
MASKQVFPHTIDLHLHREETGPVSRTTSQHRASNSQSTAVQKVDGSTSQPSSSTTTNRPQAARKALQNPQRRHFVFSDPVAFRYISVFHWASLD